MDIKEILAEANLSESQIDQIVGIVDAGRAELRETHLAESTKLVEAHAAALADKDSVIEGLMRTNVDQQRMLTESTDGAEAALQTARSEGMAAARKMLVEALQPYRDAIRGAKGYQSMVDLVESLQTAFAGVMNGQEVSIPATQLNESAEATALAAEQAALALAQAAQLEEANTALADKDKLLAEANERIAQHEIVLGDKDKLLAEANTQLFEAQKQLAFAAATVHLAETTKEKVTALMGVSTATTLEEYNAALTTAVETVGNKKSGAGAASAAHLQEGAGAAPANPAMASYVAALGTGRRAK